MLPFFGLTMKLGPIAGWGLNLHENLVPVDTEKFETLDARRLRRRRHQHLSGQAEAHPLAASTRRRWRRRRRTITSFPDKKLVFQYTTSSTNLQRKLGVS